MEKIAGKAPLDRLAGQVTQKGVHFDATKTLDERQMHWEDCPGPARAMPKGSRKEDDLTGKRFERLVVVSWWIKGNSSGAGWLVKCDCGRYEVRRTKGLKTGGPHLMCRECDYTKLVTTGGRR